MSDEIIPLALVTGAAHRLGRAFALYLARSGFAILLHYHRSQEKAEQTAKDIGSFGVPVYLHGADLTDQADVQSLFESLDSIPYKLKVLVNSAAIMKRADIRKISVTDWDTTFALNLRTPFLLAQQAAERMTVGGLIVNITDAGAQKAWNDYPTYVVSKSALKTLTRVLAKAYAPKIRVNAIAPGLVLPSEIITHEEWNSLVDRLPLKRPVSEDEVTAALNYLVKNEAITGQVIVVDGGYSLI